MDRDTYARFSSEARYVNIQPLCSECNNIKGSKACDYRKPNKRMDLLLVLHNWGILGDIEFEDI